MNKIAFEESYAIKDLGDELEKLMSKIDGVNLPFYDENFVLICELQIDMPRNKHEEEIKFTKNIIKDFLRNALNTHFILVLPKIDEILLFVGFDRNKYDRQTYINKLREVFYRLQREIHDLNRYFKLSAGVSSSVKEKLSFKKAYTEAHIANEVGKKIYKKESITFYDDLGIYKFLHILDKEDVLEDENIRCLYEYDKKHNTNLIETLEAFMDSNGKIRKTAEKVFAHPNTIKYRLNKIKELVGEDILKNESKRLYYYILIKATKLISD
ncbi:PucR family transcriptional regulator [Thermoanaerobacter wiegelii]|uniref:Putative transcriptional regulator, PucR family n=1 Tax=Thermoanaerobacter wiegelii Rt8.B1 TaxID=697303 RepID=G2MVR6_9THEO|nr:helix-turn-helix domain-containing protein [Thermoanaerobacter wiegelii]AEM79566.1 putative transcriptional regulator, PucR family [Thermoanaerobacter wiegelii Rt8.B1]